MRLVIAFVCTCMLLSCASNRPTKAGLYKHTSIPEFAKKK